MSPDTAMSATAAAAIAFNLPIERMLAMPQTTSNESLAMVAVDQWRISLTSSDLAAATVPSPNTRSLTPMVRSRSTEAPVGCSRRDRRKNGPGAAISAAPTAVRSQPILSTAVCVTGAAYPAIGGSRDWREPAGAGSTHWVLHGPSRRQSKAMSVGGDTASGPSSDRSQMSSADERGGYLDSGLGRDGHRFEVGQRCTLSTQRGVLIGGFLFPASAPTLLGEGGPADQGGMYMATIQQSIISRVQPGRFDDFLALNGEAVKLHERLGVPGARVFLAGAAGESAGTGHLRHRAPLDGGVR